MSDVLTHVRYLAEEIGPRGTGTQEEAAAADYAAGQLSGMGLPYEKQEFRAVASQNAFPLAINMVALLAVIVYPLGGSLSRWIAAGLAMSTPFLLWQVIRYSNSILRPLLPQVNSRNVVASIEPRDEIRQRVVILAHLDTNRCRLIWQSSMIRHIEPLTWLTFGMLASLGLIYLAGAILGGPGWTWWVSLLPAAYAVGSIITLWRDDRTPFSPGANDNAASVAVALEIAARLSLEPLRNSEVWLAFTGAEESDHAGLYELLREHDSLLRQAVFIGLEGVGGGNIVYLTREGVCFHYRPDPELLAQVERVAASRTDLDVGAAQMTVEDEVGTLRRVGYRAICIAGRDPDTGSLPHWHRPDDTLGTISVEAMGTAADFVTALLDELDRQTEATCAHS
ncbi:MAG: M28 family peptidase [Chloroflexota bacterium]|nr:M28 family peptidase [Chloroflexota bacterium]